MTNPLLIVAVLSPSTEAYDRSDKFSHYAQIPALRHYLLVAQDRILVDHFQRGENGAWLLRRFSRREEAVTLDDLSIAVPLEEVYEGLEVPPGLLLHRTPPL